VDIDKSGLVDGLASQLSSNDAVGVVGAVALTLYKLGSLAVGLASLVMGYRLFVKGVWGDAGDVEGVFNDNRIVVKRAAPGTFFALFGTVVLCFTIFKGFDITQPTRTLTVTENSPSAMTSTSNSTDPSQFPEKLKLR
jgi:hypothetical protein